MVSTLPLGNCYIHHYFSVRIQDLATNLLDWRLLICPCSSEWTAIESSDAHFGLWVNDEKVKKCEVYVISGKRSDAQVEKQPAPNFIVTAYKHFYVGCGSDVSCKVRVRTPSVEVLSNIKFKTEE